MKEGQKTRAVLLKPIETNFVLQWHVTNKCENRCSHCYITNLEKELDNPNKLTLDESKRVIDDLVNLGTRFGVSPRINFSGGNPLLRNDFPEIMRYAKDKGVIIGILGNPSPLTEKNLEMLCQNNVSRYQVSLEGMRERHDSIRGEGNYDQTIEGVRKLSDKGIWVSVMNTVSKRNYLEVPEVCETAFNIGVKHFDFARLVPVGEGKDFLDEQLTPKEFREFLFTMHKKYEKLIDKGVKLSFIGRKDPLWYLMDKELGIARPFDKEAGVIEGCSIGKSGLCLDVDGSIYSCRRMPLIIGNIRNTNLSDFFLSSKELNEQREFEKIESCGECDLINVCRGCRAVAYANTGDYFSKDPQCWREE